MWPDAMILVSWMLSFKPLFKVNINILGANKQKWMEWVNLNQMTIISTIVGKNPLEEME